MPELLRRKFGPLTGLQWLLVAAAVGIVGYFVFRRRFAREEGELAEVEEGAPRGGASQIGPLPGPIGTPIEAFPDGDGEAVFPLPGFGPHPQPGFPVFEPIEFPPIEIVPPEPIVIPSPQVLIAPGTGPGRKCPKGWHLSPRDKLCHPNVGGGKGDPRTRRQPGAAGQGKGIVAVSPPKSAPPPIVRKAAGPAGAARLATIPARGRPASVVPAPIAPRPAPERLIRPARRPPARAPRRPTTGRRR